MAFLTLLRSSPRLSRSKWALSAFALLFCFISFLSIDRYTVFSHTALVDQLPFLTGNTRSALEASGCETSYAIDPRSLTHEERERLDMIQLKGLGLRHYLALDRHGIDTVSRLAGLDEKELALDPRREKSTPRKGLPQSREEVLRRAPAMKQRNFREVL